MDSIDKINKILKARGMTGADLSRMIGASTGAYSNWNTRKSNISNPYLNKIANALEVAVEDLLPDEEGQELTQTYNSDMEEMLTYIKDNPGMRILFNKAKDATPEQLFAIAQMIETFKQGG